MSEAPTILFVLGMFRSGTSALTRVLSLSGATLPPGMMGAGKGNPRGFWEPRRAVFLNDTILRDQGSSPTDPRIHDHQLRVKDVAAVRDYLRSLPAAPVIVLKDLQITTVSELWFTAAESMRFNVAAAVCVRHPQEVVESVDKMSPRPQPELSAALWLKYTLLAERCTRHIPRVFIDYANLLDHWQHEVKRISAILPVELEPDAAAVEEYLCAADRHQVAAAGFPAPFGMGWLQMVYEQLRSAARDADFDCGAMDCVLSQYRGLANGFGAAFRSCDKVETIHRVVPRPLARLWVEGHALAHGRRGTWA